MGVRADQAAVAPVGSWPLNAFASERAPSLLTSSRVVVGKPTCWRVNPHSGSGVVNVLTYSPPCGAVTKAKA
jgi:hypothetical protein